MPLFKDPRQRTIALNILAEFSASIIYTLLYLVFIARFVSEAYDMTYVSLALAIGLAFFAAIFIPLHTYRIHILPFLSVINALRKRQKRILWHKIPAQIVGAAVGAGLFHLVNRLTTSVRIADLYHYPISDPWLAATINSAVVGLMCYTFYLVRVMHRQQSMTGTVLLGLFVSVFFAFSGRVGDLSALNPFGLLFHALFSGEQLSAHGLGWITVIHVIAPLATTYFVFVKIRDSLVKPDPERHKAAAARASMKNYDV